MQVSLLNQELIVEKIQSAVELKLRQSNDSRTYKEQVLSLNLNWKKSDSF